MDGDVVQALIPTAIAAVIFWRAMRGVRNDELQKFVDRFRVRVDEGEDQFVRARLRRSRALRLTAVAIGVLVAGLPAYMNLIAPSRSADFASPIVGNVWIAAAASAALLAEVLVVQWPAIARRTAVIEARRPTDYVARRWTRRLWLLAVVTPLLAAIGLAAGRGNDVELVAGAGGAMLAGVAAWVGLRQIAERPRLAPDGHRREIDDALRSYGAHHLVGAAIALATTSLSIAITAIVGEVWLELLGIGVTYYGLGVWWAVAREQRWPVQSGLPVS